MPDLKDAFTKLKSTIVKTQTQKIDSKLDTAVKDILTYKSHGGRNGYIDLMKSLISKTTHDVNLGGGTGGDLFNQGVGPATFGQSGRVMRYKSYQAITSNISYCFRALQVLVENILSPDDITKVSLEIKPIEYIEDEIPTAAKVKYIKEVLERIGLEKKLDLIIRNTLLFGDFFCEIADPQTALTSRSILSEAQNNEALDIDYTQDIKEKIVITEGKERYEISIDYSAFVERVNVKPKKKKSNKLDDNNIKVDFKSLKDLQLVFYEPQYILRLQSKIFPICFGYLVFPPQEVSNSMITDQAVNNVCISILKNLEKKIPQVKELKGDKELRDIIQSMLAQTDMNKSLEIRYVPPDKMTHFLMPTTKYYPYGESIFDSTQFSAKVIIALETALAIQRISRSTEKRKIAIEVGLPRDARKAVESMKEEFRKRKVSLDSFGTVDTIPSMITTFEDVYIPQRDGKPFVDISTFTEGNVDTRSKVDEIKQMRDQLVASLGVPPSFIGIEENLCLISDTYIPLLNGFSMKLEDIIEQYDKGNMNMYIYSYDHSLGKLVPAKITWAGYTKMNTKCIRVWLDNDKYIDCTPEHPFMLRDGTYKEAQYLLKDESLMPFYTKSSIITTSIGSSYEMLYHPGIDKWQLTHQAVNSYYNKTNKGYVVHHKDYNPRNNHPENLSYITNIEHSSIHGHDKVRCGTEKERNKNRICDIFVEQECIICKQIFERKYNNNSITCSPECKSKYHKITGQKLWKTREKNYPVRLIECPLCGKTREFKQKIFSENKFYSCQTNEKCTKFVRSLNRITKQGTKLTCDINYSTCEACGCPTILSSDKNKILNTCNNTKCINTVLSRRGAEKKKQQSQVNLTCPVCNKKFTKAKWYVKSLNINHITCGQQSCISKMRSLINIEKYKHNWTTTKCIICNEEFRCTKIYKNDTQFPCCDNKNCQNEIWYLRNKENKKQTVALNHKVKKVEILEGLYDTGDITVEKYHNFATQAGVIVHNSNKNALSEENILFARTIIRYQKFLTDQINDLIVKIFNIIIPEKALVMLDTVNISFPVPKSLQFERESRYMNELTNLIESLERIGVPKEYAKKRYLPQFDWEEIKKYEIDEKVEKALDPSKAEDDMGMGEMGGVGGAPMPGGEF